MIPDSLIHYLEDEMPRITALTATVENMERMTGNRIFAFDPVSMDRFSANPADYFYLRRGEALKAEDGRALLLAREDCQIIFPTA